ncbi:MAG: energy-coupling factor transporter transmembrane protein EcfT [Eggerthellaceae bacterium]|nr:energy-coupling factor transporter transmembrane protein EcfT [Eggerthellaceae bacterium]MBQ9044245.1 energy-coupling factor transporter transmembrane protein EcfT [Eggerthellaceae bacterium]
MVHRCDARAKIVLLLAFSIGIFFAGNWLALAAFAIVAALAVVLARLPFGEVNRLLAPVYVLAAFSVLFNVIATPSVDGLMAGLFFGVRMIVLIAASFVVCLTTSSNELLGAFRWFIGPLKHLRVPVDDIAFTLALSLRFIPVIEREFETVRAAQKSRGAELSGSLAHKLSIWGAAFSAVFVGLFRHADALATAMDARCYGAKR